MSDTARKSLRANPFPVLTPRGNGHQFVFYGDSCSGVPGAPHEKTFASVNAIVDGLSPSPEFIVFPGDEVIGLTADADELRMQWRHWHDVEMAWLDRETIPLYHSTSNHTTYDVMSERVFAEMLPYLPRNGPADQQGLSYFVRRDDLLMVFIHTSWSGMGGEGHVETEWLAATLQQHHDAGYKFVIGHHPVFPINGFSGAYQREIGPEYAADFWRLLVENGVFAYLCSHILAFDVQVHDGVLQITSAGAGTEHRMPEGEEYLHCVQAALDTQGLRYQVLDVEGRKREQLSWPFHLPPSAKWSPLTSGEQPAPIQGSQRDSQPAVAWRFSGRLDRTAAQAQTLLSAWSADAGLAPLWIGLTGPSQRLTVLIAPTAGRSPHAWFGPNVRSDGPFALQVALHADMGPGGVLWRESDDAPWNSLDGASAWGPDRLVRPAHWSVGSGKGGGIDRPFVGPDLKASYTLSRPG